MKIKGTRVKEVTCRVPRREAVVAPTTAAVDDGSMFISLTILLGVPSRDDPPIPLSLPLPTMFLPLFTSVKTSNFVFEFDE